MAPRMHSSAPLMIKSRQWAPNKGLRSSAGRGTRTHHPIRCIQAPLLTHGFAVAAQPATEQFAAFRLRHHGRLVRPCTRGQNPAVSLGCSQSRHRASGHSPEARRPSPHHKRLGHKSRDGGFSDTLSLILFPAHRPLATLGEEKRGLCSRWSPLSSASKRAAVAGKSKPNCRPIPK